VLKCTALLALALLPEPGSRAAASDTQAQIVGRWLTESRNGIIEISAAEDATYQGKIIGGDAPHRCKLERLDPDKLKVRGFLAG
jgi:hypothetical protein